MTALLKTLGALGTALVLVGCEHAENYRWSSDSEPAMPAPAATPPGSKFSWIGPSVAVYSYATPQPTTPAVPATAIKDLSDHGQAALIQALIKAGAKASTIRDLILKPPAKAAGAEGAAVVEESFNRTLVATVTKGIDVGPGDRLVWTWVDIQPKNFVFDGYTVVATDNEVLNIEQIQNQTTASIQAQAGKTTSDTSANTKSGTPLSSVLTDVVGTSLGATASLSNQYTTSAAINQQYVKLSADIMPRELRIYHESERNMDVAGNTLIALTMRVDPDHWRSPARPENVQRVTSLTVTKDGKMLSPANLTIEVALDKAPPHCKLIADVTLLYELRRITKNARSYVEGEQAVKFKQGSLTTSDVEIAPADAVRKPSWRIYPGGDEKRSHPIKLVDIFGQILPLDFSSYEQARDFTAWMNKNAAWLQSNPSRKLGKSGLALSSGGPDLAFPRGEYYADRAKDPHDIESRCKGMEFVDE